MDTDFIWLVAGCYLLYVFVVIMFGARRYLRFVKALDHFDDCFDKHLNDQIKKMENLMSRLSNLETSVAAEDNVQDAVIVLLLGLSSLRADAGDDMTKHNAIWDDLSARTQSLAAAVTANTIAKNEPFANSHKANLAALNTPIANEATAKFAARNLATSDRANADELNKGPTPDKRLHGAHPPEITDPGYPQQSQQEKLQQEKDQRDKDQRDQRDKQEQDKRNK